MTTAREIIARAAGDGCEDCQDTGYVEISVGGIWLGEGIKSYLDYCQCECGQDARTERALAEEKRP